MNASAAIPQQGELNVDHDHLDDNTSQITAAPQQPTTINTSTAIPTDRPHSILGGLIRRPSKLNAAVTSPIASESNHMGRRKALVIGLCVVLFGGSFYVGTMYQGNQDQSIASQYVPVQSGSGNGTAGSGGTNSQVAAALSVGEPPSSPSSSATTSPQAGTSAGSPSGNTPATDGSPSAGSQVPGGPAATSAASSVNGQIAGLSSTSLTVHTRQGTDQTIAVGSATRYFVAQVATQAALTSGTHVVIAASSAASGQQTATSVTIVPSAAVAVSVQPTGVGQRSVQGTSLGQSAPQGQGTSGALRGQGLSQGQRAVVAGTITANHGNTLTLTTTQGTITISLSKTTHIYSVTPTTLAQVKQNWSVAVSTTTAGSASAAGTVVASSVANTGVRIIAVQ